MADNNIVETPTANKNHTLLTSGKKISTNYIPSKKQPLDQREVVASLDGLAYLLESGSAYNGLIVYVADLKKYYQIEHDYEKNKDYNPANLTVGFVPKAVPFETGYSKTFTDTAGAQVSVDSVASALDTLFDAVMKNPTITYSPGQTDKNSTFEINDVALNMSEDINISFSFDGSATNNCTIQILRKDNSLENGQWSEMLTQTRSLGRANTINLGKMNTLGDFSYRLYVKDGLGKDAFTPWKDPTSPADAPVSYGYLEFRRWCSDVNFTLPVSSVEQTTTYVLDEIPTLDQSVSYKAAISGTGYILYQTIEPGQDIPTSINFDEIKLELKDQTDKDSLALNNNWRIIEIQTPVVGSGPIVSSKYNMYIPKSTTGKTGIYTLAAALLIDTGKSRLGSSIATRSLDRLEANALAVTAEPNFDRGASIEVNTDLKLQVYTKTTITDLKVDGGITVAGAVYYDATNVDEKSTKKRYYYCPICNEIFENSASEAGKITTVDDKKYHASCYKAGQTTTTQALLPMCMFDGRTYGKAITPGVVSEQNAWNVGRLTSFPDLEDTQISEVFCVLALTATPNGVANSPIILNWHTNFSLKKPNEQLSYSRDRLVFQLNTLENTNNLTGSLSAPDDHSIIAEQTCNTGSEQSPSWNRLGIKLFNTVKDKTGLVTTTTDSDGACIHLTKNTYGIMYKQDNEQPALGQESTSFKKQLLPYSPFNLLRNVEVDATGTPLPKGFTFETLIKGVDIGNQEAQLASFRTELFDDAGKIKPNNIETDKGAGINIALDSIKGCVGGAAATYPLMADTWQHLVVTIDTTIDESSATDLRPFWTIRYYINGTLVKAEVFNTTYIGEGDLKRESTFGEVKMLPPLTLNGATAGPSDYGSSLLDILDSSSITVPFNSTGECKIKVLRIYSKALSNQEVFANYLSTCDTDTSKEVLARNGDEITKIYFVANNLAANSSMSKEEREKLEAKLSFYEDKGLVPGTFKTLHSITKKEDIKDDLGLVIQAGSKSALVNCTMYVYHIDTNNNIVWTKFDDVDVFLQGTSSLEYPVKNYKIKGYTYKRNDEGELERKSLKITPPPVNAKLFANGEGMPEEKDAWTTPAKAYTLKCDYMEHSHRNNTPTACYFEDTVLDTVIASQHIDCKVPEHGTLTPEIKENRRKYYSPARSVIKTDNSLPVFRDVINGFPCIVYYAEVGVGGTWEEIPANDKTATQDKLGYNTNCTHRFLPGSVNYTGSYMFNVDKSGDQLGFDISPDILEESKQLLTDSEKLKLANMGISDIKDTGLKCISYEGGANEDNSAAAFLSFSHKEAAAVETFYNAIVSWAAGKEGFEKGLLCALDDESTTDINEEKFYSLEDLTGSEYIISNKQLCRNNNGEAGEVITLAAFAEDLDNNKFKLRFNSGSVWNTTSNSFAYIKTTLEPRHSYTEDLEGETEEELAIINDKTYMPINRAIKWATAIQKAGNDGLTTFRKNFEKYFSLDYCIAYYLQMLMFTQVDNAGKNAMFDIWGTDEIFADLDAYNSDDKNATQKLGKIFPRPYDMDTQMGIDNKGSDRIPVTAELHIDLSPNFVTASDTTIIPEGALPQWFVPSYSSKQDTTSDSKRFTYNTSSSFLWKAFGKAYLAEITTAYAYLRDQGVYDVDAICNYVDAMTYYKIGEKFYNDDASVKYLSFKKLKEGKLEPDTTYLKCISGNRRNRYRQFLQQRITFLDSFFGYTTALGEAALRIGGDRTKRDTFRTRDELSGNKPYNPKAVIAATEVVYAPVGIAVHTPQYVHIEVADGKLINYKVLVEPTDKYTFNGKPYNGALFYIPVVSNQSDKEATIFGIGNIRSFNHLNCIAPAKLSIGAASKLVDLDLSNCNRLLAADLILPNSDKLQQIVLDNTPSLSGSVHLESCSNLVSISATNSNITTFYMPEKSSLQKLNLQGSSITDLTLSNNTLLTNENINLMNCNNLSNLAITNCSGIIIDDDVTIASNLPESEKQILKLRKIDSLIPDFYKRARNITLSDCTEVYNLNFSKFNKLNGLYLANLPKLKKLDLTNNTSSIFIHHPKDKLNYPGLDLSKGLDNLTTLELAGAGTARFTDDEFNAVKLPCTIMDAEGKNYLSKTSLSRLTLANSKIGAITTTKGENKDASTSGGSSSGNSASTNTTNFTKGEFNFEAIPGLTTFTAQNCVYITTVKNLEYTGSCNYLFRNESSYDGQSSLTGFENCHFTTRVDTLNQMFMRCRKLESLEGLDLTITPNKVDAASVDYLFYYCTNLDLNSIKKVTQQLASGVTSNGKLTIMRLIQGACTNQNISLLPSDFFGTDEAALSRIVSLEECFSHSPFKIVPPGFFDKMSNLTDIDALFRGSSKLMYIPQNSFYNNHKLNAARVVFCDCTKLGYLEDNDVLTAVKDYNQACMLKPAKEYFTGTEEEKEEKLNEYSSRVFSENASPNITNIEGIFYNCGYIDPADGLTGFFANLTDLTNAKFAFYSCASLSKLSKDILKLKSLTSIDGLFMNCGTASTITSWSLPESLFGDGTLKVPVKTASGLFAGCTKLTGNVPHNFLKPIADTVEHIGTRVLDRAYSGGSHALPGIFANTKLSSLPNNLLENMSCLQDCSGLIMGYSSSGTVNTPVADNSSFLGFTYLEEKVVDGEPVLTLTDPTSIIPLDFFNAATNKNLTDISYSFAGCSKLTQIEGADPNSLINPDNEIFKDSCKFLPESVESAAGLFFGCKTFKYVYSNIFKNKQNLKDISYCFTNCALNSFDFNLDPFANCTQLAYCNATFMGNKSMRGKVSSERGDLFVIPATLFNSCRSQLTQVENMFAGCSDLDGALGVGEVYLNDPATLELNYTALKTATINKIIDKYSTERETIFKKTRTKNIEQAGLNNDEIENLEDELVEAIKQDVINELEAELQAALLLAIQDNLGTIKDLDINYLITNYAKIVNTNSETLSAFKINLVSSSDGSTATLEASLVVPVIDLLGSNYADSNSSEINVSWDSLIDRSETKNKIAYLTNPANKVVDIKQVGLLGDCVNLTSVAGMFYECCRLRGTIPADLFAGTGTASLPISYMQHMFAGCSYLNTTVSKLTYYPIFLPYRAADGTVSFTRYTCNRAANFSSKYPHILPELYTEDDGEGNKKGDFKWTTDPTVTSQTYHIYETGKSPVRLLTSEINHFLPSDWLATVDAEALTNISYMFRHIGTLDLNKATEAYTSNNNGYNNYMANLGVEGLGYKGYPLKLTLPDNLFANKFSIQKAVATFHANAVIGKTAISSAFLSASTGSGGLANIESIFAHSALPGIIANNSSFLGNGCSDLTNIKRAFYYTAMHQLGRNLYSTNEIDPIDQIQNTGLFYGLSSDEIAKLVDFNDSNRFPSLEIANVERSFVPKLEVGGNVVGIYQGANYSKYTETSNDWGGSYHCTYATSTEILNQLSTFAKSGSLKTTSSNRAHNKTE